MQKNLYFKEANLLPTKLVSSYKQKLILFKGFETCQEERYKLDTND